jgi:hypothetical protein
MCASTSARIRLAIHSNTTIRRAGTGPSFSPLRVAMVW